MKDFNLSKPNSWNCHWHENDISVDGSTVNARRWYLAHDLNDLAFGTEFMISIHKFPYEIPVRHFSCIPARESCGSRFASNQKLVIVSRYSDDGVTRIELIHEAVGGHVEFLDLKAALQYENACSEADVFNRC